MTPIRTSAKAVVVVRGRLLLVRKRSLRDDWYALPGGGQRKYETLDRALVREVREETGYRVKPGRLVLVTEYIGRNHEFAGIDRNIHQVDFHFLCRLLPGRRRAAAVPDEFQRGVEWVPLSRLGRTKLYPKCLRRRIPAFMKDGKAGGYLGDIN